MSKSKSTIVSKSEALELISAQLRRSDIENAPMVKLLALYSKLNGWDAEKPEHPEEVDMDKLVAAVEKKRKSDSK